jgi:hypothetical protein
MQIHHSQVAAIVVPDRLVTEPARASIASIAARFGWFEAYLDGTRRTLCFIITG